MEKQKTDDLLNKLALTFFSVQARADARSMAVEGVWCWVNRAAWVTDAKIEHFRI